MKALKLHDKVTIIPRFYIPCSLWGRSGTIVEIWSRGSKYKIETPDSGHYWIPLEALRLISSPYKDCPNLF